MDDGPGFWDSNVSGGYECNYEFEWYVDDEYKDFAISYATDFPSSEYNPGYHHIDLVVHDGETTIYRGPFEFELGWCLKSGTMGDSIQIYPNPADEYIDVRIIDEVDNIISGQKIQLNDNKENKGYTYSVIDNYGKVLLHKKTSEKYFRISTTDFLPGTYHIQVISAKGKTVKQFIVSH